jgi:hypothetical protein
VRRAGGNHRPLARFRSSERWCACIVEQLLRARLKNVAEAERGKAEASFRQAIEIYRRIAEESPAGT